MIELFVEKRIGALEYGMFAHEVYAEYYVIYYYYYYFYYYYY